MNTNYSRILTRTTALVPATLLATVVSHANPLDGQVVAGGATITTPAPTTEVITQQTNSAIINWKAFDIGVGETTKFVLPDSTGVTLNRVVGSQDPSKILGTLTSNGTVMVVNPDGILFGPHAVVNVGGLLATTSDISDQDFMAKNYQFTKPGNPNASIVNQGTITVKDEGIAALVAPGVRNEGVISAKLGKVTLGAGNKFTLDFYGDDLINLMLDDTLAGDVISTATGKPLADSVANAGTINADGGTVVLKAATARQVVNSVINNTGVIEANTVGLKGGKIVLGAQTASTKQAGTPLQTVKVSGLLNAQGKNNGEKGGTVYVTAEAISAQGATINASGRAGGGTIAIGGDYRGHNATQAEIDALGVTYENALLANASFVSLDDMTTLAANATESGNGGKVVVWSNVSTDSAASIAATGGTNAGNGGFAEVSGHDTLVYNGNINTSAAHGKTGTLLLDPTNATIDNNPNNKISATQIEKNLATTNVIVTTAGNGTDAGDIIVGANISWNTANSLRLEADRNITVNSGVTISNFNTGDLVLRADRLATGSGRITLNGTINYVSSSGSVSLYYDSLDSSPGAHDKYLHAVNYGPHVSTSLLVPNQLTAYMLVNNVTDLQAINTNLAGNYALGIDFNASSATVTAPIGSGATPFTGRFNGDSRTISNLTMNLNSNVGGLFGATSSSAIIEKLILNNASLQGSIGDAGMLVGDNYGTIRQVSVNGTITQDGGYAGMLVGVNYGSIDQASVSGNLNWVDVFPGFNTVGGLAGSNETGATISNSVSSVNVKAVNGTWAGFAGFNRGGTITDSYSTGPVNGGAGFVGAQFIGSVITTSYWDTVTSGKSTSNGGTGQTTTQLKTGLPVGFDPAIWSINGGYPYLKWTIPTAVMTTILEPGNFVGPIPQSVLNPSFPTLADLGSGGLGATKTSTPFTTSQDQTNQLCINLLATNCSDAFKSALNDALSELALNAYAGKYGAAQQTFGILFSDPQLIQSDSARLAQLEAALQDPAFRAELSNQISSQMTKQILSTAASAIVEAFAQMVIIEAEARALDALGKANEAAAVRTWGAPLLSIQQLLSVSQSTSVFTLAGVQLQAIVIWSKNTYTFTSLGIDLAKQGRAGSSDAQILAQLEKQQNTLISEVLTGNDLNGTPLSDSEKASIMTQLNQMPEVQSNLSISASYLPWLQDSAKALGNTILDIGNLAGAIGGRNLATGLPITN